MSILLYDFILIVNLVRANANIRLILSSSLTRITTVAVHAARTYNNSCPTPNKSYCNVGVKMAGVG